jgi:solute carrier family 35 protein
MAPAPAETTSLIDDKKEESVTAAYRMKLILAISAYMVCSAGMTIVNKEVIIEFGLPLTIVLIQMIFAVAAFAICFWLLRAGSWEDVYRWARVVPPLFALMLGSSMLALSNASMGAVTLARNIVPLINLPIEAYFQEKIEMNVWTYVSLGSIVIGISLYIWDDLTDKNNETSLFGLAMIGFNMICAMVERLVQRRLIAVVPVDLSKTTMLLINNALAAPAVLIAIFLCRTSDKGTIEPSLYDRFSTAGVFDYVMLSASCVIGLAIGWTGINAQFYVTATTLLVVNNMNKIVVIAFGILWMHEDNQPRAVLGVVFALGGGMWYAFVQQQLNEKQKALAAAAREEAAKEEAEKKKLAAP